MTPEQIQHAIKYSFHADWYLRDTRRVVPGKWTEMCICTNCGIRGAAIYHLMSHFPCPHCGEMTIQERIGRYVIYKKRWFRRHIGYWQLKEES